MKVEELKALQDVNELRLSENEEQTLLSIFSQMEEAEESLQSLDLEGVKPMVYVRPIYNVLREDKRVQPFEREDLLKGAPQRTEDSWQVPRLVKQL